MKKRCNGRWTKISGIAVLCAPALVCVFALSNSATAVTLYYEGMNYIVGTDLDDAPDWDKAGELTTFPIEPGSLSFSTIQTSGNSMCCITGGDSINGTLPSEVANAFGPTSTETIYISALMTGTGNLNLRNDTTNQTLLNLQIDGGANGGWFQNIGTENSEQQLALGNASGTKLYMAKIELDGTTAAGSDTVSAFYSNDNALDLSVEPAFTSASTRNYNVNGGDVLSLRYKRGNNADGQAGIDEIHIATTFAELLLGGGGGPLPPVTDRSWKNNITGDWNVSGNWNPSGIPGTGENLGNQVVNFGVAITSPELVYTHEPVSVRTINFDNLQSYAIAGHGRVNLIAGTDGVGGVIDASINVAQGSHEFQARVSLIDNTTVDVATDSALAFNHELDLMGNTLTKTGAGNVAFNNKITTSGGQVDCAQGICSGNGTISGDLNNLGGTLSPGNSTAAAAAVPEPTTVMLAILAMVTSGCITRRRKAWFKSG